MQDLRPLSLAEFAGLLGRLRRDLSRKLLDIHLHQTCWPDHQGFRGPDTLEAMRAHYRNHRRLVDVPFHLLVDPQGLLWPGRSWNLPPASVSGFNGTPDHGPLMVTLVGLFEPGRDPLAGAQLEAAVQAIALVQKEFGLGPDTLRFHGDLSKAPCPGPGVPREEILQRLRRCHEGAEELPGLPGEMPFDERYLGSADLARALTLQVPVDEATAEPDEDRGSPDYRDLLRSGNGAAGQARWGRREEEFTPEVLEELRPHVVNLNQGRLSRGGLMETSRADLEAMVDVHLKKELEAARARGGPLRIVLYAHGGLVPEKVGLQIARHHIYWWKQNEVYPVYFVWETGFGETLGQMWDRVNPFGARGARDLWDHTTDPALERAARTLGGVKIWGAMKYSAERSVAPDGGAHQFAELLARFLKKNKDSVEVHAVGHSAGSIFHAHFLPHLLEMGDFSIRTLHLMAPAIRADEFLARLEPQVGKAIGRLTLFTMKRSFERDDDCQGIYRKSLLYLIHHALEPEPETPILGLEDSLWSVPGLKKLFGLGRSSTAPADIVWSKTSQTSGRSASQSHSHGGFDDDPATMNSIARRILNLNQEKLPLDFKPRPEDRDVRIRPQDLPQSLAHLLAPGLSQPPRPTPATSSILLAGTSPVVSGSAPSGARRALCVGINAYPGPNRLAGCVNDAWTWHDTLAGLGFQAQVLADDRATWRGILDALAALIESSRAGDVLVFQYSGHGTTAPDLDGDESGGDTPGQDEALCPIDMDQGRLLIDDDLGELFDRLPPGVGLTCFMDCCHSGTITRMGVGRTRNQARPPGPWKRRFLPLSPQVEAAHVDFRRSGSAPRGRGSRGPSGMREVLFAACLSSEVAYESGGQGHFTARATRVLGEAAGMTNREFRDRVLRAFGPDPDQHPDLYCSPGMEDLPLLGQPAPARNGRGRAGGDGAIPDLLRQLASALQGGGS